MEQNFFQCYLLIVMLPDNVVAIIEYVVLINQ